MPTRKRLPNRRPSRTFEFEHNGGMKYIATYSCFEDGSIGELFLNTNGKVGSEADIMAADGAAAISVALQYGTPARVMLHAMKHGIDGKPLGVLSQALGRCLLDTEGLLEA